MNKDFCTYEQALALKELGFDEPCLSFYADKKFSDNIILEPVTQKYNEGFSSHKNSLGSLVSAPLYQQAFRWFREKYNFNHVITPFVVSKGILNYDYCIIDLEQSDANEFTYYFKTYEEAEQACLDKLIEICKNK